MTLKLFKEVVILVHNFLMHAFLMYALYYLYEWNSLRTQPKMEMTLSKNNALVIGNGLKSRRIYC